MAATERFKKCKYCEKRFNPEFYLSSGGDSHHHRACPMRTGLLDNPDPVKLAEWQAGWDYGFEDNYLMWWQLDHYSPSWQLGYRLGKDETDRLIERAVERNYGYEYDDYDE